MTSDITYCFYRSESDHLQLFVTPNLGQACLIFNPLRKLEMVKYVLRNQLHPGDVVRRAAMNIARLVLLEVN